MGDEWLKDEMNNQEEIDMTPKEDNSAYVLNDEPTDTSITDDADDPEIAAIKARVKEMEEEAEKLKEMQKEAEDSLLSPSHGASPVASEAKGDIDSRSVYVGNVDYSATATELEQHFHGCGSVNRVTILCDKFSGHPKGFAYVEFADKENIENAIQLTDSLFKGRQIKVVAKRTNVPGISTTNRGFRGRGRGRGFRGSYGGGFYSPRSRGRGAFRSRRAQWFSPY